MEDQLGLSKNLTNITLNYADKKLIVDISVLEICEDLPKLVDELTLILREKLNLIILNKEALTDELYMDSLFDPNSSSQHEFFSLVLDRLKTDFDFIFHFLSERNHQGKNIYQYIISRHKKIEEEFIETRIAVIGNVDAGKSTLLGVLCYDELDDGRGTARSKVFTHAHELATGRTSSIGSILIGFDEDGKVVKKIRTQASKDRNNFKEVCKKAAKVVAFIDLAGHEKYLKTTIYGLIGLYPDFAMLVVGANMGCIGMTYEHMKIASSSSLPVFIVITKIDMCPPDVLKETKKNICKMVRGCNRKAYLIADKTNAVTVAFNFNYKICPVFLVSNVSGEHLDTLKLFFSLLIRKAVYNVDLPAVYYIDLIYKVPGVGTVVFGVLKQGKIKTNQTMKLGPFGKEGHFVPITVKSMHRHRLLVNEAFAGQSFTIALKNIKKRDIRKGMVIIANDLNSHACYTYKANIFIYNHSTTISNKYNAMVHLNTIRQAAKLTMGSDVEVLRSGEEAPVSFTFLYRPEYIQVGDKIIFREGRTRGDGIVTSIEPYIPKTKPIKV